MDDKSKMREALREALERETDPVMRENYQRLYVRERKWFKALVIATRPRPAACECCGMPASERTLALDHDHNTGEFRGWICCQCNSAIGFLGDTLEGAQRAVDYLTRVRALRDGWLDIG